MRSYPHVTSEYIGIDFVIYLLECFLWLNNNKCKVDRFPVCQMFSNYRLENEMRKLFYHLAYSKYMTFE